MTCAICRTRRPRRFCPGVRGDICSICCGTEREVTVDCPFDCEYLQESRKHQPEISFDPQQLPHRDIQITEKFLHDNEPLLRFLGQCLAGSALATPGAVDLDIREALEALIRTQLTLQSGVYYESVPSNPLAANIYHGVQQGAAEFRRREQEQLGVTRTRDADVLGVLVFLQRLELSRNNGRRRGRSFLHALSDYYGAGPAAPASPASSLILP